jgi:hypothetical protein
MSVEPLGVDPGTHDSAAAAPMVVPAPIGPDWIVHARDVIAGELGSVAVLENVAAAAIDASDPALRDPPPPPPPPPPLDPVVNVACVMTHAAARVEYSASTRTPSTAGTDRRRSGSGPRRTPGP